MCAPCPCGLLWIRSVGQISQRVRKYTMQFDVLVNRRHELFNGGLMTRVEWAQ